MKKLRYLVLCLFLSCFIVGSFGLFIDLISFPISFEYFKSLKFIVYGYEGSQNWLGAAAVGFQTGAVIGFFIGFVTYFFGLPLVGKKGFLKSYAKAMLLAATIGFIVSLGSLIFNLLTINENNLPSMTDMFVLLDPVAFAQVAIAQNSSFYGMAIGGVVGCLYFYQLGRKSKQKNS